MTESVIVYTDEGMIGHDPGSNHPERPARLRSILDSLQQNPPANMVVRSAQPVSDQQRMRVHSSEYLAFIDSLRGQAQRIGADTVVSPESVDAARLAAGAAVEAVNEVVSGDCSHGFAVVRPPGHHAERSQAMGFCLHNNIAIAAEHALVTHGLNRVLILDWDVHHGNGTQRHFETRPDVLYFSIHQWPLFPGTGAEHETGKEQGEGYTINVPLAAGADDQTYCSILDDRLSAVAEQFQPELVLVSAGYDAHRNDPLGGMNVTTQGFLRMTEFACSLANRHGEGQLVLVLEGGYNIPALTECVRETISVL